jgi:hypothetical protein
MKIRKRIVLTTEDKVWIIGISFILGIASGIGYSEIFILP